MNIKDLQKAWSQLSAEPSVKEKLTEEQIREILGRKTNTLMERIDNNIRWGLVILFAGILTLIAWDFLIPAVPDGITDSGQGIPVWVTMLDRGLNLVFLVFLMIFFIQYKQVRRKCGVSCDLRQSLLKVIRILTIYRRLFVLALIIFLMASASGYLAGFYSGVHTRDLGAEYLPFAILAGILTLMVFTGLLFLMLRWIFRRMYGKYLKQLNQTLIELDDLGD